MKAIVFPRPDPDLRPRGRLRSWDAEAVTRRKNDLVLRLHRAGARLMLGTDTGLRYLLPGFTVHEELERLTDAGLTPGEALATAL